MATRASRAHRRLPYLMRMLHARPRLFIATVVGLIVMYAMPDTRRVAARVLIGWDVGVALYLILVYHLMSRADTARIRQRAAIEDEGQIAILVLTVGAAMASLGAIIAELGHSHGPGSGRQPRQLILALVTILLSWALTHTIFALHYAHEFYSENGGQGGGLTFPGAGEPDYWDFVYFSFVIGMTSQVSDVAIACKPIRRTVTAHGVISFIFNAALLALTVNIAAGAI
jgi:uncharacterized membrane protein